MVVIIVVVIANGFAIKMLSHPFPSVMHSKKCIQQYRKVLETCPIKHKQDPTCRVVSLASTHHKKSMIQ